MKRKLLLSGLIVLLGCITANAQELDFRVLYNAGTGQYEVYVKPTFTNPSFRFGTGSQLTLLLPAAAADIPITITSSVAGGPWTNNSQVYAPAAQPANDFQSIVSGGSTPVALNSGTEIELFTFIPSSCISGVRMYTNGVDANGMLGGDWNNSLVQAITLNDYTGVPYLNIGTVCNPLATTLISFTGKLSSAENAILNWSVTNEEDMQMYAVERSQDAASWNQRTIVTARGKGSELQNYDCTDNIAGLTGSIYYRLKMVDLSGRYTYSPVVKLSTAHSGNGDGNVTVFPTTVRQGDDVSVRLENIDAAVSGISIYNAFGQLVRTIKTTTDETVKINTAGLAAGTYFVRTSITELSLSSLSRFIVL